MSSLIKFRVWNKKEYKFIDWRLSLADGEYNLNDIFELYPEYIIQQFTGLTDKDGKEIYEGDFIFVDELIWEVEFRLGCFMIIPIEDRNGYYGYLHEYSKDCLVVGNKFESKVNNALSNP